MPVEKVNFFIIGVCKAQNQAIRGILHVIIMEILARAKNGRGVSSQFQRVGVIFLERGMLILVRIGGAIVKRRVIL